MITKTESYRTVRKRLSSIKPSPENGDLYRDPTADPDIAALAESIEKRGLQEPLILTADNFIISGHRRYTAMKLNGQVIAPCRVAPVRRADMSTDEFVALLREHNRQRRKSVTEQMREAMLDQDPIGAYATLRDRRQQARHGADYAGIDTLEIEGKKRRHVISGQKADHVKYVRKVIFEDRRQYWPLSVRGVHYALLNYKFLRNIPRMLKYRNDDKSYQATSDLLTRMRLKGNIPWSALDDGTRPIKEHHPFSDVESFVRQETESLFAGYWRDLLQTQECHVEVLCEKNTIYHMVQRVTEKYQIPTSSGRGFNSIDPWHDLVVRYRNSSKERLVVIVLSDYDPEGEMIPQVGGRTLRDDFGLGKLEFDIVKAGVTRQQIEENDLPTMNFAKETSSNFDWFVARNDGDESVYELEALEPEVMMNDLDAVIRSVLDIDAYNAEIETEQDEAVYLENAQEIARDALKGLLD